jgi:hypothetical protein
MLFSEKETALERAVYSSRKKSSHLSGQKTNYYNMYACLPRGEGEPGTFSQAK